MAEDIKSTEVSSFDKLQTWFEKNQKPFNIGLIGLLAVVLGSVYYFQMYIPEQQQQAEGEIYKAQEFFAIDSFTIALNGKIGGPIGDDEIIGFLEIAEKYGASPSGNLAKYYAGVCYLRMGEFQSAIDWLAKYKPKDKMTGTTTYGAMGDAYLELGDNAKALENYKKAAAYYENNFTSPFYLFKAGQVSELSGNNAEALAFYQQIETKYPKSQHGTQIDQHIARVK